jgi:hypothetical protein
MTALSLQLVGAICVGCIHGAVGAYLFCYLKIVHHWDPVVLSMIFGTHGAFFIMRRFKRAKERIARAAAPCKVMPA